MKINKIKIKIELQSYDYYHRHHHINNFNCLWFPFCSVVFISCVAIFVLIK